MTKTSPQTNEIAEFIADQGNFSALLDNAEKVSRPGGGVTVQTRTVDRATEISIQDCGAEIDPKLAESISRPFEEAPRSPFRIITAKSAGSEGGTIFLVRLPIFGT